MAFMTKLHEEVGGTSCAVLLPHVGNSFTAESHEDVDSAVLTGGPGRTYSRVIPDCGVGAGSF